MIGGDLGCHMEGPKLISCCSFLLLRLLGELLLKVFLGTLGFSGGGSQMGFYSQM